LTGRKRTKLEKENIMTGRKRFIAIGLALLAAIGLGGLLHTPAAHAQEKGLESLRQSGMAFRSVAKKVSPAVVFIQVEKEEAGGVTEFFSPFDSPFGEEFLRRFFGQDPRQRQRQTPRKRRMVGQGSGFIISQDGYIMTNNHVVGEADKVRVQMQDGREYDAAIIGTDPPSDLAVIKIEADDLPSLALGDSDKLEVGDWVLAVGNPFGLSHTLTAGIVSAKGRSGIGVTDYENFIQTDAAINPGNSGGPLVNLDGEVVGINTAIVSRSGGSMGIGFAIPVNMARGIRDQLIATGQVTRGLLGVVIQDLTEELARSFDLDKKDGILVAQVMPDSPAEKAGLERGDVIRKIDGDEVENVATFRNRIAMTAPGTKVKLTIVRDGKSRRVKVTIGSQEADEQGRPGATGGVTELGLSLQKLTPQLAQRLGYDDAAGVLVSAVEPGSAAAEAGMERGDLIQEINRQPVTAPEQARRLIAQARGKAVLLLIRHGDRTRYLALPLDN
jgi:serine protease Do